MGPRTELVNASILGSHASPVRCLVRVIRELVGTEHYLHKVVKNPQHRDLINLLVALRNFAAHESPKSKAAALDYRMRSFDEFGVS